MVDLEITDEKLIIHVLGIDVLLAFKSQVEVPLTHVTSVEAGVTDAAWDDLQHSLRVGTALGTFVAGSYRHHGEWMFWYVHDRAHAVTIGVEHDAFKKLVIEVPDPEGTVRRIQSKLKR